jgi:hypothetical protein
MGIDNLSITTVPEPSALTLLAGTGLLALARRRPTRRQGRIETRNGAAL